MRPHTPARPHRLTVVAVLFGLAACGAETAPDPGPRFADENHAEISCMRHQPHAPGPRYTDDTIRRTDDTLAVLRYYTDNGRKAYCDGAGPTDTDQKWIQLYVTLGAERDNVAPLLDERRGGR